MRGTRICGLYNAICVLRQPSTGKPEGIEKTPAARRSGRCRSKGNGRASRHEAHAHRVDGVTEPGGGRARAAGLPRTPRVGGAAVHCTERSYAGAGVRPVPGFDPFWNPGFPGWAFWFGADTRRSSLPSAALWSMKSSPSQRRPCRRRRRCSPGIRGPGRKGRGRECKPAGRIPAAIPEQEHSLPRRRCRRMVQHSLFQEWRNVRIDPSTSGTRGREHGGGGLAGNKGQAFSFHRHPTRGR